MRVGYIRVSKHEQNEALQRDALQEAKCEKYFTDTITGSTFERKGLEKALAFIRPGDTFVEWKLDRLGVRLRISLRLSTSSTIEGTFVSHSLRTLTRHRT